MLYLFIFVVVVAIWQLLMRFRRAQQLKLLTDRSTRQLRELKQQLTNRHLIVSHLTDSLPDSFDVRFERQKLQTIGQNAESSLSEIDPRNPCATKIGEFALLEQGFISVAQELVNSIVSDRSVSQIHLVTSCLEGLEKCNAQINACKSIYNLSAMTCQNIRQSSLLKDLRTKERFVMVDFEDWVVEPPAS